MARDLSLAVVGIGYGHFLTEDVSAEERARAHGGVDLERLAAVRERYDPDGVVRGA